MDTTSDWKPAAMSALAASTLEGPKGSPLARDSDSFECAFSRASCRSLDATSCGEGATFHPSMSSADPPLSPTASFRYARAVAAAFFCAAVADFLLPLPPAARSRTYFVPEALSTTGSARRATPWTTGLISSRPLLMYRSAELRPVVTRVVLCRGFSAQSVVGTDQGHSIGFRCQFVEPTVLALQLKVCRPDRRRLASNCGARVCA